MNFQPNQPVWLTIPNGRRFAAVAVEPPSDDSIFTFAFYFDQEIINHIVTLYGRPVEFDENGLLEGDVNELDPDLWDKQFALIPGKGRRCYAMMATDDRENDDYSRRDDFDCKWDGFIVEPRNF